ncbi:MAG: radical SAM protein [Candidatus Lokiarchaeota archaeon]|nr:radical SAM protein [Candidatus Lokiarchaeota archaeon]
MAGTDIELLRRDPRIVTGLTARQTADAKQQAFLARVGRFGRVLHCHAPGFTGVPYETDSFAPAPGAFESISVTGASCALQCDHCRGHLLRAMRPAGPEDFEDVLKDAIASGARGVLVSGGAGRDGKVPILPHVDALRRAKERHGVDIVVHSGFMDDEEIRVLGGAGVDGIMFDVPGSAETVRSVCHLDKTPADFGRMVATCKDAGLPVMPHVIIGLDWGQVKGEIDALVALGALEPDVLVLVILMALPGTPMAGVVPDIDIVEKVILAARVLNPTVPVQLGCARPHGDFRTRVERFAVECGVNGIAYPLDETVERARQIGLEPAFHGDCCSLVRKHSSEARR